MKKVIIISGGSDGLGKETARILSKKHQVVILSPSEDKLKKTSEEIGCDYEVCDIRSHENIQFVLNNIISKHNRIDCLINNAGIWIEGELDSNEVTNIIDVLNVNITGTIILSKEVIPYMKKNKSGLIININSQAGLYAKKDRSVYTASKWAVTGFTKCLQSELSNFGISVTGLYPGKMKTKMFEKLGIHKDMSDGIEVGDVARTIDFIISQDNKIEIPELGIKNTNFSYDYKN